MIKKIRRKRIVVKQKELVVVKSTTEPTQTCPFCHTTFVTQKSLSPVEKKQLPSAEITDKHECS